MRKICEGPAQIKCRWADLSSDLGKYTPVSESFICKTGIIVFLLFTLYSSRKNK